MKGKASPYEYRGAPPAGLEDLVENHSNPCTTQPYPSETSATALQMRQWEATYTQTEIDELHALIFQVTNLQQLGLQKILDTSFELVQSELDQMANTASFSELQDQFESCISDLSRFNIVERNFHLFQQQFDTKEVTFQTIVDLIKTSRSGIIDKLLDIHIDPTNWTLEEIREELMSRLEEKWRYLNDLLQPPSSKPERKPCSSCFIFPNFQFSQLFDTDIPMEDEVFHHLQRYPVIPVAANKGEGDDMELEITNILQLQLDYISHQFPDGVSSSRFWLRFKQEFRRTPYPPFYGMKDLYDLILATSHLFHFFELSDGTSLSLMKNSEDEGEGRKDPSLNQTSPGSSGVILFPCCKEKSNVPFATIWRYYHELKILFGRNQLTFLKTDDDRLKMLVGAQAQNWDLSLKDFVQVVIEFMKHYDDDKALQLLSLKQGVVTSTDNDPESEEVDVDVHYVYLNSASVVRKIYELHGIRIQHDDNLDPRNKPNEPLKFVPPDAVLNSLASQIRVGDSFQCIIMSFGAIDNFAVHIDEGELAERTKRFFEEFQKCPELEEVVSVGAEKFFAPQDVKTGMFVVVAGKFPVGANRGLPRWSRGRVMSTPGADVDDGMFGICLVDYGNWEHVKFSQLRPMPQAIFDLSPALAIPCSLRIRRLWMNNSNWLESEATKGFVQVCGSGLTAGHPMQATFRESVFQGYSETCKWIVSLRVGLGQTGQDDSKRRWVSVADQMQERSGIQIEPNGSESEEDSDNDFDALLSHYM